MKLQQLAISEIVDKLTKKGLVLQTGSFSFSIQTRYRSIAESISILYADFDFLDHDNNNIFVDFHISIEPENLLSQYFSRRATFLFDGFAPFNSLPSQHAPAIIEWGMNWCVSSQINTHLIIHAAVIERSGYAAIMPAPPGSGKSTLTAALIQEGWRLLSDELTIIDIENSLVQPFPRPVSLKNQSIDIIRQRYPEVFFGPVSTDTTKGNVCHMKPPLLGVQKQLQSCPVGWVIFPKYEQDADAELNELGKGHALIDVATNAFNYSRLGKSGFDVLRKVIDNAACYQFRYSKLDEAVATFSALEPPGKER